MATCYVLADMLKAGLDAIRPHVSKQRNGIPILNNILLMAQGDALTLAASDLETTATVTIPAAIDPAFAVTVPARTFSDLLERKTADVVELEAHRGAVTTNGSPHRPDGDDLLTVTIGARSVTLTGLWAADFPILPERPATGADYNAPAWCNAVLFVAPFAEAKPSNPTQGGIAFRAGRIFAADGFTGGLADLPATDLPDMVLPATSLEKLAAKIAKSGGARVRMAHIPSEHNGPGYVLIASGPLVYRVHCIEGRYSDWTHLATARPAATYSMAASDLLPALKLADVFAREADDWKEQHRIAMNPHDGGLQLVATSMVGCTRQYVPAILDAGAMPEPVGVNARLLMAATKAVGAKSAIITLGMPYALAPILVSSPDMPGRSAVVMPMKLTA